MWMFVCGLISFAIGLLFMGMMASDDELKDFDRTNRLFIKTELMFVLSLAFFLAGLSLLIIDIKGVNLPHDNVLVWIIYAVGFLFYVLLYYVGYELNKRRQLKILKMEWERENREKSMLFNFEVEGDKRS